MEQRKVIRKQKLALRAALSPEERQSAGQVMAGLLFSCPLWKEAEEIFSYVSFREEADTLQILRGALAQGKKAAVPKVEGKRRMSFYYIDSMEELNPGFMGIPEPSGAKERKAVPGEQTLFIMPGAAFDTTGARLGYGGGFYDTYLAEYPSVPRVALAYSVQLADRIPSESHDIRVGLIITEKGMIRCSQDFREIR